MRRHECRRGRLGVCATWKSAGSSALPGLQKLAAGTAKHSGYGLQQDRHIGGEAAFLDVLEIHADPVVKIADGVAAANLPEAGDARLNAEFALVPHLVADEFVRARGPGT